MASDGPRSGSTFANDATVGTVDWSNPSNAAASDDSRATAVLPNPGDDSKYLKATGFGFAIPPNSQIAGVVVISECQNTVGTVNDNAVRLVIAGVPDGANKAAAGSWGVGDFPRQYGSANDRWDLPLTAAVVNASDFGVAISANNNEQAGSSTAAIDHIEITVHYTGPNGIANVARAIKVGDGMGRSEWHS